jgi:hypothetical protein
MASKPGIRTVAVVMAAGIVAGCGSDAERPAPPAPKLPFEIARRLATDSDRVAAALDAADPCGALDAAQGLQRDAVEAINAGRVPAPFREELLSAVNDLVNRIECVPEEDDDERGRGKGKGKGKGKDKGKDRGEEGD